MNDYCCCLAAVHTCTVCVCAVEAAGGKCLPCVVDIRFEDQVAKAVAQAVETFGGIDIVVNNASAISLTSTAGTTMKKFVRHHRL